jgi:hypothetical protein
LPRPLSFGRPFHEISERGPRTVATHSVGSSARPWCNGHVGTFGLSYAAQTQAALGCLDAPGLTAQFLDCGGFSNAYRSGIRLAARSI